jgi:hypothetical protein
VARTERCELYEYCRERDLMFKHESSLGSDSYPVILREGLQSQHAYVIAFESILHHPFGEAFTTTTHTCVQLGLAEEVHAISITI